MNFQPGLTLPDVRISSMGGRSFALGDLKGKPVLIYGWASWSPSRAALSGLQEFHASTGLALVTIAFDVTGVGAPMEHLKKAGANHHLLIDSTCTLTRKWGVRKLPFLLLLDEEGRVIGSWDEVDASAITATLANRPDAAPIEFPAEEIGRTEKQFEVEVQLQACTNLLGRGRIDDAKAALEKALELDPENDIIRGQIATIG
jgi:peroxiredoxin